MSGFSSSGLARALAALLAVSCLVACGPRTIRTLLSPQSYKTYVTLDLIGSDGSRERQTQSYRCNIIDVSDSLSPYIALRQEGSSFWREQADGSILVVGDIRPCRWAEKPRHGLQGPLPPLAAARVGGNVFLGDSYVFDNGVAPTRIDVLVTHQLFTSPLPRVEAATFSTKSQRSSERLDHAFPGLAKLQSEETPANIQSGLEPGVFSGLAAKAYKLSGADCGGPAGDGLRILTIPNACLALEDCSPTRTTACQTYIGSMKVDFDARFARGDLRPETLDRLYSMTLYSGAVISAASPPMKAFLGPNDPQTWSPQACYQDLCVNDLHGVGAFIYDPKEGVLIEIGKFSKSFRGEFAMREYMFAWGSEAVALRRGDREPPKT